MRSATEALPTAAFSFFSQSPCAFCSIRAARNRSDLDFSARSRPALLVAGGSPCCWIADRLCLACCTRLSEAIRSLRRPSSSVRLSVARWAHAGAVLPGLDARAGLLRAVRSSCLRPAANEVTLLSPAWRASARPCIAWSADRSSFCMRSIRCEQIAVAGTLAAASMLALFGFDTFSLGRSGRLGSVTAAVYPRADREAPPLLSCLPCPVELRFFGLASAARLLPLLVPTGGLPAFCLGSLLPFGISRDLDVAGSYFRYIFAMAGAAADRRVFDLPPAVAFFPAALVCLRGPDPIGSARCGDAA